MNNERTFIEKLLVVVAWTGLIGGIADRLRELK
jgi:hypothetical protein